MNPDHSLALNPWTQPSLPNPYEPRPPIWLWTQPSLPNPFEPKPPIGSEPIPCIVNPDGVSSSMAPGQLQGGSSGGDGYNQKFSMAFFLPLFLDISCHCWIGSLGFLLGLLRLLLFGFVEFLFNFFGLGFRCWMHRLFGFLLIFFGWWICC